MRGRMCKVRFQSRALVGVRAAFVAISLGPFFLFIFFICSFFSFYFIVFHFFILFHFYFIL